MERSLNELRRGCQLDDAARVHDGDALREMPRAGEVVRDVQDREVLLRLELVEEVEDLGAARRVDHRDGLVCHEVVRPEHHGPRDADTLPLAARERVRVLLCHLGCWVQLDLLERRQHPGVALGTVPGPVDDEWLLDDLAHAHERTQAREGILEDDLRALAEGGEGAAGERGDVLALEDDAAARQRHEAQGGATQRRLAAAGFADQGHGLAAGELQ
jgi:hypothetical protein